jgi:hypothetical protein
MVYASALGADGAQAPCGFESHPGHGARSGAHRQSKRSPSQQMVDEGDFRHPL